MKLDVLLKDIKFKKKENFNPEISSVTCDSGKTNKSCLFACLKGTKFDGHEFAKKPNFNAAAILAEQDLKLKNQILVENSHKAYAKICANFYGNPAKKLKFIGVTGTNGKTTVSTTIKNIITMANIKTGLIGTIQNEIGDKILKTSMTTPDHLEFQNLLKTMATDNCEYVSMEVSSHALDQERIADTVFEIGIFTNLTQEHLDYHKTLDNYFEAKKKLFKFCKKAVICVDDEFGLKLSKEVKCEKITFASKNINADFIAKNIKLKPNGVEYDLINGENVVHITFPIPGMFSVQNSMAAAIACLELGFDMEKIAKNLELCPTIKGRNEIINTYKNFNIICDYAHTPDSLEKILKSIKEYCNGRIVTVFGCGGDRDKLKRPLMGKIAAKNSDFLIITSDNPRTEEPDDIIKDIIVGIKGIETPYVKIADRKKAIAYAIKNAKKNDTILLAGKGHETYQIVGTKRVELDERTVVKEILSTIKD